MDFETVIGLEVHCELKTNSKMFSSSPVTFGKDPNTMVNVVDLGMPGTMPILNKAAVECAIRVCTILHMEIDELVRFDRKNYYYADLPKGFQITQHDHPIGKNGTIEIDVDDTSQIVEIERLHMEEDTAKLLHFDDYSLIDYNRAGIPLIEIVTKPTIYSRKVAVAYLEKLRQILLFSDVSDAKMEEGSMRCDVNVSIRPVGNKVLGTKTEIKNLNSISNVAKAIDYEVARQKEILLSKGKVIQETRRYDEAKKKTVPMRSKEDTIDYKYYPEPNILPIRLNHDWVKQIQANIPDMPDVRIKRYINEYRIPKKDALNLVATKEISDFFETTITFSKHYKSVSNWILGEIQAYLNKENQTISDTKLTPAYLAKMIYYIQEDIISSKQAKKVFEILISTGKNPKIIIEENHMKQISDPKELCLIIEQVLNNNLKSIEDYKKGKDHVVGFLMGQIMKVTKGQVNPGLTNQLLIKSLKERMK